MSVISNPSVNTKSGLMRRVSGLITAGGIPASIVAFFGDLFTPVGGWMVVGALGVVALIAGCYVLAWLRKPIGERSSPWWYRLTSEDHDLGWIWRAKNPFAAHAVHVLLFFGVVCIFVSQKSFAAASDGGVLAKNMDMFAAAQIQLGISKEILAEQRRTNELVQALSVKADGLKKEISDNPRVRLADQGVAWEAHLLTRAIKRGDGPTVQLFLAGGMPVSSEDALSGFTSTSAEVKRLLIENNHLFEARICPAFLDGLNAIEVAEADSTSGELVNQLCANSVAREHAERNLTEAIQFYDRQRAEYKELLARRRTVDDCVSYELRDQGRPLMREVSSFSLIGAGFTLTSRQQMIAELSISFGAGLEPDVPVEVRKYCERQATEAPNVSVDDREVKKWKAIKRWIG